MIAWARREGAAIAGDAQEAGPGTFGASGEREVVFERVLDELPHGVVVVDRELVVDYVNSAATQLIGGGDHVRHGFSLPDEVGDLSLRALVRELFQDGAPKPPRIATVEGGRLVSVQAFPARGSGLCVLVFTDVTKEERTRLAERRFVENAAHELRTPLAAIVGVIDVLEGGAKDEPEARDRFLLHLRRHSARLTRLATSLLALARIQAGQQEARMELVQIHELLELVVVDLQAPAGVNVSVRAPHEVAALTDRELLHQAVYNVAENAVKNTQRGEVVLEARAEARTTEIEIRDTGIGMSAKDQDRAYERFHRAPESENPGFGLGLTIAKDAIEALGGTISLTSQPSVGTRVRITLPGAKIVA
jgi:two-component system phosphate regulon sensor histidine kinase PhoR